VKVIVSEIPEDGLDVELNDPIVAETVKVLAPVRAQLHFDKQESDVIVTGVIEGSFQLQCSRCLKQFNSDISARTEVIYHPFAQNARAEEGQLHGEELDTTFYRNDEIDTDELLTEQILLNLPMKALCSPDCKGICPQCGADLSIQGCSCKHSETDPRLAVLQQLLPKKKE